MQDQEGSRKTDVILTSPSLEALQQRISPLFQEFVEHLPLEQRTYYRERWNGSQQQTKNMRKGMIKGLQELQDKLQKLLGEHIELESQQWSLWAQQDKRNLEIIEFGGWEYREMRQDIYQQMMPSA